MMPIIHEYKFYIKLDSCNGNYYMIIFVTNFLLNSSKTNILFHHQNKQYFSCFHKLSIWLIEIYHIEDDEHIQEGRLSSQDQKKLEYYSKFVEKRSYNTIFTILNFEIKSLLDGYLACMMFHNKCIFILEIYICM